MKKTKISIILTLSILLFSYTINAEDNNSVENSKIIISDKEKVVIYSDLLVQKLQEGSSFVYYQVWVFMIWIAINGVLFKIVLENKTDKIQSIIVSSGGVIFSGLHGWLCKLYYFNIIPEFHHDIDYLNELLSYPLKAKQLLSLDYGSIIAFISTVIVSIAWVLLLIKSCIYSKSNQSG